MHHYPCLKFAKDRQKKLVKLFKIKSNSKILHYKFLIHTSGEKFGKNFLFFRVSGWTLDNQGNLLPWNQDITSLEPFVQEVLLGFVQEIPIYTGQFHLTGVLNIYFGYRLEDGTMVSNLEAMEITVIE